MKVFGLCFVLLMSFLICSEILHDLDMTVLAQGGHRNANSKGEAAVGVLVKETKESYGNTLELDVNPQGLLLFSKNTK